MKKIIGCLLILCYPLLSLAADNSLSFAPPPSDYSVVFLSDLFGVVDGVLSGSGSQIMGTMFGVFNAAVLALGGIVIAYTLIVSTVNTAHEGQMLGQKWSSIWVPVRATLGLALLIPKATGYCLMQIFVMWVCVQGVGAADKVWSAALSYLNRGGVIIQPQISPSDLASKGGNTDIFKGASTILTGQTCMLGLQRILTNQLSGYQNSKSKNSGPCSGTPTDTMKTFCNVNIPDFLSTVNFVSEQNSNPGQDTYTIDMPNFDNSSPFYILNGICGKISWNSFKGSLDASGQSSGDAKNQYKDSGIQLSQAEIETTEMSRVIALQQMYQDLSSIAQAAINNDPLLSTSPTDDNTTSNASDVAKLQFGIPLLTTGQPCTSATSTCTNWGPDTAFSSTSPLFGGTEFQQAVGDYNGIMAPALNSKNQIAAGTASGENRQFLSKAESQGWIMAGSYFFGLVQLSKNQGPANPMYANNGASSAIQVTDNSSGLGNSTMNPSNVTKWAFDSNNNCIEPAKNLCIWMQNDASQLAKLTSLINGEGMLSPALSAPSFNFSSSSTINTGLASTTIFGYINNASTLQLPSQPGLTAPQFAMHMVPRTEIPPIYLPAMKFPCENSGIFGCLGIKIGEVIYDTIIIGLWNFSMSFFLGIINSIVNVFVELPIQGISYIFLLGVKAIQNPLANPIVSLSIMGINYINFANALWFYLLDIAITSIMFPIFGLFVIPLLALVMPLLVAWIGVMVAVGFLTAYYVPFLPYMIFTFGSIAWLMAVIEAMVAAPVVALGITHPEGEGPFGKGEQAIMLLMNVFLRPAMMIIGYIAGIALSYVAVWLINAGFSNVLVYLTGNPNLPASDTSFSWSDLIQGFKKVPNYSPSNPGASFTTYPGYSGWAGIYSLFFSILMYTSLYLLLVQKSFQMINILPDKVLRWIGSQPESIGQESSSWGDETKGEIKEAGKSTQSAAGQRDQQILGKSVEAGKGAYNTAKSAFSDGGVSSSGGMLE